jgi:hypothetical protein
MALKTQNWRKKGGRMKITIEILADGEKEEKEPNTQCSAPFLLAF